MLQVDADALTRDEVILAALCHDIGHLVAPADAVRMPGLGVLGHAELGGALLGRLGGSEALSHLIASHVAAKRYLCARQPGYLRIRRKQLYCRAGLRRGCLLALHGRPERGQPWAPDMHQRGDVHGFAGVAAQVLDCQDVLREVLGGE